MSIKRILHSTLKPALGCTEHVAISLGVAGVLCGLICGGARPGCALKADSSGDMASWAASLAMRSMELSGENGIVADTAKNAVWNLKRLNQTMQAVDDRIIQAMLEKLAPADSLECSRLPRLDERP